MTHADLVVVAERWLRKTRRCRVVLLELTSAAGEQPDAIGWQYGRSVLVECKTSRADFAADARKPWRTVPESALGCERWYLTPKGLLAVRDLPLRWGLLEFDGSRVRRVVKARGWRERSEVGFGRELLMLTSELARYQAQGIKYRTINELRSVEDVLRMSQ